MELGNLEFNCYEENVEMNCNIPVDANLIGLLPLNSRIIY